MKVQFSCPNCCGIEFLLYGFVLFLVHHSSISIPVNRTLTTLNGDKSEGIKSNLKLGKLKEPCSAPPVLNGSNIHQGVDFHTDTDCYEKSEYITLNITKGICYNLHEGFPQQGIMESIQLRGKTIFIYNERKCKGKSFVVRNSTVAKDLIKAGWNDTTKSVLEFILEESLTAPQPIPSNAAKAKSSNPSEGTENPSNSMEPAQENPGNITWALIFIITIVALVCLTLGFFLGVLFFKFRVNQKTEQKISGDTACDCKKQYGERRQAPDNRFVNSEVTEDVLCSNASSESCISQETETFSGNEGSPHLDVNESGRLNPEKNSFRLILI